MQWFEEVLLLKLGIGLSILFLFAYTKAQVLNSGPFLMGFINKWPVYPDFDFKV